MFGVIFAQFLVNDIFVPFFLLLVCDAVPQEILWWLMRVEERKQLNLAEKWGVLLNKCSFMNLFACFKNLQNGSYPNSQFCFMTHSRFNSLWFKIKTSLFLLCNIQANLDILCVVRPELFKSEKVGNCKEDVQAKTSRTEEDEGSSEDDGLPPLEANTNRLRPRDLTSDEESGPETDTDS